MNTSSQSIFYYERCVQVLFVEAQETQFELEIFLESYLNRDHQTAAGECCFPPRRRNSCNRDCNNVFTFCTGPSGQASVDTETCPYGMFSFTIRDDDFDFPFSTASPSPTIVPGSPNPIVFQGSERWTVSLWWLLLNYQINKPSLHFSFTK